MGKAAQLRRQRRQDRASGRTSGRPKSQSPAPSKSTASKVVHVPTEEEHLERLLEQASQLAQESFPGKGRGMVSVKVWQEQGFNKTGMTYTSRSSEMPSKVSAELDAYDPQTQFVMALVNDDGSMSLMTLDFDQARY